MPKDRRSARRLDAALSRGDDPALASLAEQLRATMASSLDPMLAERALNRALGAAQVPEPMPLPSVRRVAWRTLALGFALVSGISGAALVATQLDERPPSPVVEPSEAPTAPSTNPSETEDPEDGSTPTTGATEPTGDPSAAIDCDDELRALDADRERTRARYEQAILPPGIERDDALADLDRELAAELQDLADEERDVDADHRAQMRELEEEWRDADEEDRRDIEREMEELQQKWDAAITEIEVERRAVRRGYDRDRDDILDEYADAVTDARGARDRALAGIDQEEHEVRARCA